jgi:hypothetical protein
MKDKLTLTLKDLIDFVEENKDDFPQGLETPITCGDSEGNYTHALITPFADEVEHWEDGDVEEPIKTLFLQYEMHENLGEW